MTDPSERGDLVHTRRIALEGPDNYLGLLTLNRAEELDPLDKWTVAALNKAIDPLVTDPAVCVIAITGTGRGFCAGGDIRKYVSLFDDSPGFPPYGPGIRATGYFRTVDGTQTGVPLRLDQVAQYDTPRRRQDNEAVELFVGGRSA
jgi:enoyl-CoA hydratase/carnithine racemase